MTLKQAINNLRLDIKKDNKLNAISGGFCTLVINKAYELPADDTVEVVYGSHYAQLLLIKAKFGVQDGIHSDVHEETFIINTDTMRINLIGEQVTLEEL